jgi:hypothetical protein
LLHLEGAWSADIPPERKEIDKYTTKGVPVLSTSPIVDGVD